MRRTRNRIGLLIVMTSFTLAGGRGLRAQEGAGDKSPPPIAATVDGDPVYVAEVDIVLLNLQKARKVNAAGINTARAELLSQIINRRLVERVLRREGTYISNEEIDKELERVRTQASSMRLTLDQYVEKQRISVDTLRHELAWNLGWERYLEARLGEALEGYFNEHRKELDGTQVRASHVLLRPARFNQPLSQVVAKAEKIWEEIKSGKLTFEQAVEKYSDGPSRRKQGDLGFFPRFGVMHEEFSRTAFALADGEVSKPVASPFGVHLIKVTEVKPGSKQWTEAAAQLKNPAANDLFEKLAEQERKDAKIEFTGKTPYFKPGTRELILSGNTAAQ